MTVLAVLKHNLRRCGGIAKHFAGEASGRDSQSACITSFSGEASGKESQSSNTSSEASGSESELNERLLSSVYFSKQSCS